MTLATNEACILWLHENCCLMRKEWHFRDSDIQQNGRVKTFVSLQGDVQSGGPSLSGTYWSPQKENPEDGAWSGCCNNFKKK